LIENRNITQKDMTVLTNDELERYQRQLIIPEIGEKGQIRLKESSVIVTGAGGLGSAVLMYLAAAGVGKIGIIDSDKVSMSNLQRQILYTANDVTKPKAEAAAGRLRLMNPQIEVMAYPVRLTAENAAVMLAGYDIAVDCSDNYAARYLISDAARQAGIPMVFGAVCRFMGQVSVFNYRGGLSYRDLFPEEMSSADEKIPAPPGVIGPLPGIIGSVQACEVIKIITGAGDVLSCKLLQIDAATLKAEVIAF
jgi:adenylyltransferase/sulfurtransferase